MSLKKKTRQKNPTSSKQNLSATLEDGTKLKGLTKSQYNKVREGKRTKAILPKKPFSTESGIGYEDHKVEDNFDSHDFPPPSNHPEFRKFWVETIDNMVNRENFKPAHLGLLEIYCRLRVELRRLDDFVMTNGHTYRIVTITGEVRKTYPEVLERHKILNSLHKYAQLLDLKPSKDKSKSTIVPDEDEDWK